MKQIAVKDYNPDIKTHWDKIFVGPFGEILKLLSQFNDKYGTKIGITNKLSWKRGSYDQIKEAMSVVSDAILKRPRDMCSIFDNRKRYAWKGRNLEDKMVDIQKKINILKYSGAKIDYNTAVDVFNETKKAMSMNTDDIEKIDKNIKISMYIESFDDIAKDRICIEYLVSNIVLKIKSLKDNERENANRDDTPYNTIQEFKCGDVLIKASQEVFSYINKSSYWKIHCTYHPNDEILIHPYIKTSTEVYYGFSNYCFGDFDYDARVSLEKMDIFGFAVIIRRWLSEFITNRTVPLNAPPKLYIGNPEYLNKEYIIRHAKSASDCDNIMSRQMLYKTQPENFEFNPQDQDRHSSDSRWHNIANRIKQYISSVHYLETIKENLDRRQGSSNTSDSWMQAPESFLTFGRNPTENEVWKSEDDINNLITNAAKWGANKCQEIKCTLRPSCRFGYQLKIVADTLTEEEIAIEKECKQDSSLVYIRLKTVQDWCHDTWYLLQDDDPNGYENVPEVLRTDFNRLYNCLCDHLRGEYTNKDQVHNMFRMYRIYQLNPHTTTRNVLGNFLDTLEKTERAMNDLIQYLDDSEGYKGDKESLGKLAKLKKHIPNWDDLSVEGQSKAIATLVNAKII